MRAVFIGCVESSRRTLGALVDSGAMEVVGIVTKSTSSFHGDFYSLTGVAEEFRIPCLVQSGNDQEDLLKWLHGIRPEVLFCVGWPYLLKSEVLQIATIASIGYHPTDLPLNRGRHPIIWTLALGLNDTASTFFLITELADAGPIVDKISVAIAPNDTAAELYDRLMQVAEQQIVRIARRLAEGTLKPEVQDLAKGNVWRRRGRRDGLIDWRMPSHGIHNLVRALARPYPGAHCEHAGVEVKIWRARPTSCPHSNIEPGKVLRVEGPRFVVKTGDGAIEILDHEFAALPGVGDYL